MPTQPARGDRDPAYFTKPPTSLNGHDCQILKPADSLYLNCAGEYAVVFGKTRRNVRPDEAWNDIEGFCPALDMGLQNYRDTDQSRMPRTCCMGRVVQVAHIGDETNWGPHT